MLHAPQQHDIACNQIDQSKEKSYFFKIWKNQSGLTLVEMAIVLIFLGLFLSGVVPKGRQMLEDARLKKTLLEIHQHMMILSDYFENNGNTLSEDGNAIWSKLQNEGALPHGQKLQKDTDFQCPKLSNGALLSLHLKEGQYYLVLGKKGKSQKICGFMSLQQARHVKKNLELKGVEVIDDKEKPVQDLDQNIQNSGELNKSQLYAIQIPLDS